MHLDQIEETIVESASEDWKYVDGAGGERFVFKPDPRIALVIGRRESDPYSEAWATGNPDSSAFTAHVEVELSGSIIDLWYCVSVDGGRALVPYPERTHDKTEDDPASGWGWTLSRQAFRRGAALGRIQGRPFEEYVRRSGLGVEGDESFEVRLHPTFSGRKRDQ